MKGGSESAQQDPQYSLWQPGAGPRLLTSQRERGGERERYKSTNIKLTQISSTYERKERLVLHVNISRDAVCNWKCEVCLSVCLFLYLHLTGL